MDVKRKKKINLGKAYVTRKGIRKPKKEIKSPCKCRLKCFEKISTEQRKAIFEAFWKLGDHHKQWIYVSNLVSQNHPCKMSADVKKSVCDHIECLQPVESHYTRKDNSKLYLDSRFIAMPNFAKRQYKTIVNDSFKLSFFKPKKDQCDVCHK
ncbi:uncharacterized protein LOC135309947 [Plodia interpunctella]|uniref:uncharacterized protein LOC135309947 n=1 Tax=Plodia interpunctella TaxID=58824 RepID=UPI0031017DC6